MALSVTYVTRDPLAFAAELSHQISIPVARLTSIVQEASVAHEERHRALEAVSELALRATILRNICKENGELDEETYSHLHFELCVFNVENSIRLMRSLRSLGLPLQFGWEDVVVHSQRVARAS